MNDSKKKFINYCERLCNLSEEYIMAEENTDLLNKIIQDRIKLKAAFMKWFEKNCK